MPLVHPGFSQVSNIRPSLYGVYVRPPYLSAINDVIRFHDWKGVIYLYDSDDGKKDNLILIQVLEEWLELEGSSFYSIEDLSFPLDGW